MPRPATATRHEGISGVLARENLALLDSLDRFDRAIVRNPIDGLEEIALSFEAQWGLHLRGQEEALFPALSPHLPGADGPVVRRRTEGRDHEERLKKLLGLLQAGRRDTFIEEGRAVVALIRKHLVAGQAVLLPMAERLLSPSEWNDVRKRHEAIGSPRG